MTLKKSQSEFLNGTSKNQGNKNILFIYSCPAVTQGNQGEAGYRGAEGRAGERVRDIL